MKKALLSPLCSAFVIPGLGQILNQQLKKGVFILVAVFVLFAAGVFLLARMITTVMAKTPINPLDTQAIMDQLSRQDLSLLWILLLVFMLVWAYSVLDAFLVGRRLDRS